jgi:hypothetical protein
MNNTQITDKINDILSKGYLPVSFYNSQIISCKTVSGGRKKDNTDFTNNKYKQNELPNAIPTILISKIYEVF